MILKAFLNSIFHRERTVSAPEAKEQEESTAVTQIDAFTEENKSILGAFARLHGQYHGMLEMASTDYDEILIYEKYTSELCEIFQSLLKRLNLKDKQISMLQQLAKGEKEITEETVDQVMPTTELPVERGALSKVELIANENKRVYEEGKKSSEKLHEDLYSAIGKEGITEMVNILDQKIKENLKEFARGYSNMQHRDLMSFE